MIAHHFRDVGLDEEALKLVCLLLSSLLIDVNNHHVHSVFIEPLCYL